MEKALCVVDSSDMVSLSSAMSECFIEMTANGKLCQTDDGLSRIYKTVIFVLTILVVISMIFYQFSSSRKNSIKILDGYDYSAILCDELKFYIINYIIINLVTFISAMLIVSIKDGIKVFLMYLTEKSGVLIFVSLIIPALFIVSVLYIMFVRPIEMIKGKKYRTVIRLTMIAVKMFLSIVLMFTLTSNFYEMKNCYDEYKSLKRADEYFSDCYSLTISERYVDEEKYINFYKMIHKRYKAVMMTAHYCSNPESEGDIYQWYIYVNDNYMEINPIVSEAGNIINYSSLLKDMRSILVPSDMRKHEAEILEEYADRLEVNVNDINIIYYDDNQKFYTIQPLSDSKYTGYIMHPIVMIHENEDSVSGAISNGELVFRSYTSDFFSEITPYLNEYGIMATTGSSVNVSESIKSQLNFTLISLTSLFVTNMFLIFLVILMIVYETWVYYENEKKKIAIKTLDGYKFAQIHNIQILTKAGCYVALLLFCILSGLNLCLVLGMCLLEYILFYAIIELKIIKFTALILKGE